MTFVPFARQSVGLDDRSYSAERVLNWYARPWPDGGAGALMLRSCPGLTERLSLTEGRVRRMLALGGFLYVAAGGRLWRIRFTDNETTSLGLIEDDAETSMATTGTDIAVASGGELHVYQTDAETFSNVAVPSLNTGVGSVAAVDGHYIASAFRGRRFAYSAVDDATTWDTLDFFTAESAPDRVERVVAAFQEIWVLGTTSTEVWSVVGGSNVLARRPGGVFDVGCRFGASPVQMAGALYWVDNENQVRRARGFDPQRVSTEAVERLLASYRTSADIAFFSYTHEGHDFYVIRFPDRPAWCFDATTGLWHERSSGVERDAPWVATAATKWRQGLVFGTSDGFVCNSGGLTDRGDVIAREAVSTPLVNGNDLVSCRGLTAAFKTGETDLGREATVTLETRRRVWNDWRTWSEARNRSLGVVGQDRVPEWKALGRARGWQFRLRVTDPVDTALYGVTLDVSR